MNKRKGKDAHLPLGECITQVRLEKHNLILHFIDYGRGEMKTMQSFLSLFVLYPT